MNAGALVIFLVWGAAVVGWIWNIVKFIGMLDGGVTAMFIARGFGILVAPLGVILGYL